MIRINTETLPAKKEDLVQRFLAVTKRLQSPDKAERAAAEGEDDALVMEMIGTNNAGGIADFLEQKKVIGRLHGEASIMRNGIVRVGGAMNTVLGMTPEPLGRATASASEAVGRAVGGTIGGMAKGTVLGLWRVFFKKK